MRYERSMSSKVRHGSVCADAQAGLRLCCLHSPRRQGFSRRGPLLIIGLIGKGNIDTTILRQNKEQGHQLFSRTRLTVHGESSVNRPHGLVRRKSPCCFDKTASNFVYLARKYSVTLTEKYFSYFSTKTYIVGTQNNRLNETVYGYAKEPSR